MGWAMEHLGLCGILLGEEGVITGNEKKLY